MYYEPSSFVSKYYRMFCELGYPQLDIIIYETMEWAVIEYENFPLIPSLTKWRVVFSGFQNIEITESFVRKMVNMIDNRKKEFWDRIEAEEEAKRKNDESIENARVDAAIQTSKLIAKNDNLMERAAKIGPDAFSLDNILSNMSEGQVRNELGSRVQFF